jgi:hypothetical protein
VFFSGMRHSRGQRSNCNRSSDEEKHLMDQKSQTDACPHQHRDSRSIHPSIIFSDSVHTFSSNVKMIAGTELRSAWIAFSSPNLA